MRLLALSLAAMALAASSLDSLSAPLHGLVPANIRDMFAEAHFGHPHEAIDILAPTGTPVYAVVSGIIARLFLSKAGGNTIYQFDEQASYCYYYAHLDHYEPNLHDGMHVERGELIGFVGFTGNANAAAPHLHFAIFELGPDKKWWKGTPLNPYSVLLAAVTAEQKN